MRIVRRTLPVLAAAAVALSLTACDPDDDNATPASLSSWTVHPTTPSRMSDVFPHYAEPTQRPDPLSTNGRWRVPEDIRPGDYTVTPTDGTGYWKLCRSIRCEIGTDGFIENDLVDGPNFVTIPTDARYIQIRDLVLAPAAQ
ncbi:hypothetical protein [Nocardia nova]|uniref:hypothetical protein n=1 Tax=Nocardia nova TaxID=37330 RepID=UPI00189346F5|nr:hypothetical protein [Nocardia nova]MBF6277007.1 hypothetical protein [Nocardia nova]